MYVGRLKLHEIAQLLRDPSPLAESEAKKLAFWNSLKRIFISACEDGMDNVPPIDYKPFERSFEYLFDGRSMPESDMPIEERVSENNFFENDQERRVYLALRALGVSIGKKRLNFIFAAYGGDVFEDETTQIFKLFIDRHVRVNYKILGNPLVEFAANPFALITDDFTTLYINLTRQYRNMYGTEMTLEDFESIEPKIIRAIRQSACRGSDMDEAEKLDFRQSPFAQLQNMRIWRDNEGRLQADFIIPIAPEDQLYSLCPAANNKNSRGEEALSRYIDFFMNRMKEVGFSQPSDLSVQAVCC